MPESQNGISSWGTIKPQTPGGEKISCNVKQTGRKKNTVLNWDLPAAISISTALKSALWSLSRVTKAISNNPVRQSKMTLLAEKNCSLWTVLLAWYTMMPSGCLPTLLCQEDQSAATPWALSWRPWSFKSAPHQLGCDLWGSAPKSQESSTELIEQEVRVKYSFKKLASTRVWLIFAALASWLIFARASLADPILSEEILIPIAYGELKKQSLNL